MTRKSKQIQRLAQEINLWLEELSAQEWLVVEELYSNSPEKTRWNIWWKVYTRDPALWRTETSGWTDNQIDTMIRRALKLTILEN